MRNGKLRRSGFTLVEIMVVVVIMVMLASVATPLVLRHLSTSRIATAKFQIRELEKALADYRLDTGNSPDTSAGLTALTENVEQLDKWRGPYIKPAVPKDPWGRAYVYICPGEHGDFDLYSLGNDGRDGGEGENADVVNWEL